MWTTLIIMLISYFLLKKNGASTKSAVLGSVAVGAGTYYATTQTDWGKQTLGKLDSNISAFFNPDGSPQLNAQGEQVYGTTTGGVQTIVGSAADVLKSWGGTGTAAVIGTTALATSSSLTKYLPWLLGAAAVFMLAK